MNEDHEAHLVEQLQKGSTSAFQQLVELHLVPVNRYVIHMMGNRTDAEDITQDVFIRLWQKSDQFNPNVARLTTWLHQIAHNLCVDHFRKRRDDTQADFGEYTDGSESAALLADNRQTASINEAMLRLPEKQRSAIVMCPSAGRPSAGRTLLTKFEV